MLITNFSAGELSDSLFGRIDLGQYFAGVSYLENFNVIPTGGINRRPGTRRILDNLKDENGEDIVPIRIVPFILSREEAYVLIFSNLKIIIYKVGEWDEPEEIFTNNHLTPETHEDFLSETLYTEDEIPFIQHAQNFRMMVLVQKNHRPLQITFNPDDIRINIFPIFTTIQMVHSPNVIPRFFRENDKTYEAGGYLTQPGQYPGCVTFFNERIVFASTDLNGQRLFFSRVNNIHDFSTYKSYITEQREYTVIRGHVFADDNRINLHSHEEARKITEAPERYTIDSIFFPAGTRLLSLPRTDDEGETWYLEISNRAINIISSIPASELEIIKNNLRDLSNQFIERENNLPTTENNFATFGYNSGTHLGGTAEISIRIGVSTAILSSSTIRGQIYTRKIELNSNEFARFFDEGTGNERLTQIIHDGCCALLRDIPYTSQTAPDTNFRYYHDVVNAWQPLITQYMRFQHASINNNEPFYDFMPNIRSRIEALNITGSDVFVPLFTTDQIKDDYPTMDDGFTFEVASDRNDEIRWLVQNKNLIAGTESAEYVIPSNITAVSVSAFLNSFYGSSKIQASSAGDAVLFFRDGQKGLVEYHIPQADNYFRTNDLLMMAPQMLRESEAKDFDVVTMPYTMLYITRANGELVTLLYDRSLGVFAWGRIVLGCFEKVISLAVIPGKSGFDDIYLLVQKNGSYYLDLYTFDDSIYLDSYKQWNGDRSGYTDEAVIYDTIEDIIFPLTESLPTPSANRWIGYPFTSVVKSMPILANGRMKPNNIKNILIRFHDSYMPKIKSLPNEKINTITNTKPYTGVLKQMFPGVWDRDVMFELIHDKPTRCKILAIVAEVN